MKSEEVTRRRRTDKSEVEEVITKVKSEEVTEVLPFKKFGRKKRNTLKLKIEVKSTENREVREEVCKENWKEVTEDKEVDSEDFTKVQDLRTSGSPWTKIKKCKFP